MAGKWRCSLKCGTLNEDLELVKHTKKHQKELHTMIEIRSELVREGYVAPENKQGSRS